MNLDQFSRGARGAMEHSTCAGTHDAHPPAHRQTAITNKESLLFFGVSKQQVMMARFTVKLWIAFVGFCVAGYLEHLYLTRFGLDGSCWLCFNARWNGRVVSPTSHT